MALFRLIKIVFGLSNLFFTFQMLRVISRRFSSVLPKLPIPKLTETSAKYLKSVEPVVNADQLKATQMAVEEFNKAN